MEDVLINLAKLHRNVSQTLKRPSNFDRNLNVLDTEFKDIKNHLKTVNLFFIKDVCIVWKFQLGMSLYREGKILNCSIKDYRDEPPSYTEPKYPKLKGKTLSLVTFEKTRNNFAHFILEKLPILFYFDSLLGLKDFDYYLVDAGNLKAFIELSDIMGLQGMPIALERDGSIEVEELYLSEPLAHPMNKVDPIISKAYQDLVSKLDIPPSVGNSRIYIERKKGRRGVVNDIELKQLLEHYDFSIVSFDSMPLLEQIQIMNKADIILSVHGAALANLVFTSPRKKVTCIEIIPNHYVTPAFWILSRGLGIDYYAVEPRGSWSKSRDFKAHQSDVYIDIDKLKNTLQDIL